MNKRFVVEGTRITDLKTGRMAVSVSRVRKDPEERREGESWLDMRQRTKSEREAIARKTEERAQAIAAFMNTIS